MIPRIILPGRGQSTRPPSVILSAAKDLRTAPREILRCAQDDSSPLVNALELVLALATSV